MAQKGESGRRDNFAAPAAGLRIAEVILKRVIHKKCTYCAQLCGKEGAKMWINGKKRPNFLMSASKLCTIPIGDVHKCVCISLERSQEKCLFAFPCAFFWRKDGADMHPGATAAPKVQKIALKGRKGPLWQTRRPFFWTGDGGKGVFLTEKSPYYGKNGLDPL